MENEKHRTTGTFLHGRAPMLAVAGCFVLSRLLYHLAGVRFDDFAGVHLMHFLPADLLRDRLLESVFYLHTQPPLFNLFLGAVHKFFPAGTALVFHTIYLFMGIVLALAVFSLMKRVGVRDGVAAALVIAASASPSWVLFENILLYEYPAALFLVLAALFLHRFLEDGCVWDGVLSFSFMAAVVLVRSFFHLFWMAGIFVLLLIMKHDLRRKMFYSAAAPLMLVLALYAKNLYVFGTFSTSSWMGMSLAKMTTQRLPEDERVCLMTGGNLSELALLPPFKALWFYGRYGDIPSFEPTGAPVLDLKFFENIGNNWNNAAYLSLSRQYLKDALFVVRTHPGVYLTGLREAFRFFFFPSSDWFHIFPARDNVTPIAAWERLFNTLFCGQIGGHIHAGLAADFPAEYFGGAARMGFFILVMFIVSVGWGVREIVRAFAEKTLHNPVSLAILFMAATVFYVFVVSSAFETGENYRFRFVIEPLLLVLFACAVSKGLDPFRKRIRRKRPAA